MSALTPGTRRCAETRAHYAHRWVQAVGVTGLYVDCPGGPDEGALIAEAVDQARAEERERIAAIPTHNGTPVTPENLEWAATHESLARSWIFDVLTGLARIARSQP